MKPSILPGLEKSKQFQNRIKETKCGYRYTLGKLNKRRYKKNPNPVKTSDELDFIEFGENKHIVDKTVLFKSSTGKIFFCYDFGDKLSVRCVSYRFNKEENKFLNNATNDYWFKIRNGKLVIQTKNSNDKPYPKNLSNRNGNFIRFMEKNPVVFDRFKCIFYKWSRRNGLRVNKKYSKDFSKLLYLSSYPELEYVIDVFDLSLNNGINSCLLPCLRKSKGINQIINRGFGNHGKKIKQLLRNNNFIDLISFCRTLKGFVPPERIIDIIEKKKIKIQVTSNFDLKRYRFFFKNFHGDTIYKWFNSDINNFFISDTVHQFFEHKDDIKLPETNDIIEIHDYISAEIRKLKHKPVDFTKIVEKYNDINNVQLDDLKIEVPNNSLKLIEYGQKLSNCIAGYSSWMQRPNNLLLAVYKNNDLKYNISILTNKIDQFRGKFNSEPEKEDYEKIVKFLEEKKIIKPEIHV